MSIRMAPGAARLTVLGSGWSETALESGDAFTEDGELLDKVADDLGYDIGDDVDWDLIAGDSNINWDDIIYTDEYGNIYDDLDGDGIWVDANGNEYSGNGTQWLTEEQLLGLSGLLENLAQTDAALLQYSIERSALQQLWAGPVSEEKNVAASDSERPHRYSPPVFYIQQSASNAVLFFNEPFYHATASGGSVTVNDTAITVRSGSSKAVYWSSCTTYFSDNILPSQYSGYPIQYICWQCLHGPFKDVLISKNDNTITSEDIENGASGLSAMTYEGKTYYAATSSA